MIKVMFHFEKRGYIWLYCRHIGTELQSETLETMIIRFECKSGDSKQL